MSKDKISISLNISSANTVVNNLYASNAQMLVAANRGIQQTAELILSKAKSALPVMTGALKSSGKISVKEALGQIVRVISFGDSTKGAYGTPTSEYAIEIHELMMTKHPESYKFLELALLEYGQAFLDILIQNLMEVF